MLPILHLNGYKISNPTILSRISEEELVSYFKGMGWDPIIVAGDEAEVMHKEMAKALDKCIEKIKKIQIDARENDKVSRPMWPMVILRTPKGWTGPKEVDGKEIEGTFRAHQIPLIVDNEHKKNLNLLQEMNI